MFGGRAARAKRFSLLLLEEEEEYVQDWVVLAAWPVDRVAGNWHRSPLVPGRVRLCTRSLFFEPDDVRIPIVRIPLAAVQALASGPPVASVATAAAVQPAGAAAHAYPRGTSHHHHHHHHHAAVSGGAGSASGPSLLLETRDVVLMRANLEEVPYTFLRWGGGAAGGGGGEDRGARWAFGPCYSPLQPLMAQAAALLEINRKPREERNAALEDLSRQRLDSVSFDLSRLVDFGERLVWSGPVVALTPLVREQGHLAITPARVYFQPLHNISGTAPVKSHPLAAIAAVARRRSSLRAVGLELFFLHSSPHPHAHGPGGSAPAADPHTLQAHAQLAAAVANGPTWDAPSAFFAFRSEADREAARHLLTTQPELGRCVPRRLASARAAATSPAGHGQGQQQQRHAAGRQAADSVAVAGTDPLAANGMLLEAAGPWLRRVTAAWQRGALSNFDYLLYLNFAAGRSFNDLAQWPVFPWVLRNYVSGSLDLEEPANFRDLSKPVGALNPTRLEEFRRRFRDMPHDSFEGSVPPFLYGTHYSTPGYVMYWLVRAAPSHMLRLQNGRFDAPDRLFASVQEAWEGVLHSTTDVKELIPEFFMPGWDFLVNARRLPLGVRQSGRPVSDVDLPPWATDPRDFLAKHRAALESPCVSRQLHHWIDLVFGYKQRGEAAEGADNVFYYLTYEGAVDVAAVTSPVELKALETQINEFGQTPKQLFTTPHPPRLVCPPAPDPATVFPPDGAEEEVAPGAAGAGVGVVRSTSPSGGAVGSTGYGSDGDAGNRDLALALLSTIIAAAAPECAPIVQETPATSTDDTAATTVVDCTAATEDGTGISGDAGSGGGRGQAGDAGVNGSGPAGSPETSAPTGHPVGGESLLSSFLKLGRYQQQQGQQQQGQQQQGQQQQGQQQQGPAEASVLMSHASAPPVGGRVAAAASSISAAASAAAGSFLTSWTLGGVLSGHGWRHSNARPPASASAPPSDDAGLASSAGPDTGSHSESALAALGAVGPSVTGDIDPGRSDAMSRASSAAEAASGASTAVADAASGGLDPAAQAELRLAGSGAAAAPGPGPGPPEDWGCGWGTLCAAPFRSVGWAQLTRGSLAAVASGGNGYLYCAGQSGIRIVTDPASAARTPGGTAEAEAAASAEGADATEGSAATVAATVQVVRSAQLDGELLSLALFPLVTGTTATTAGAAPSNRHNRLMLVGSHNRRVYTYAPDAGRVVGSFEAHDDAVCCLRVAGLGLGGGAPTLVTSSWDCSVKLWSLAEGRAPWSTGLSLATAELRDFDSGVWALATDPLGRPLLATGTEEGVVALWDMRAPGRSRSAGCAWQAHVADDYVGGLALIATGAAAAGSGPGMVLAGTADGALTLFDIRGAVATQPGACVGQRLASVACGAPVRCCAADSRAAVAGDESGSVRVWDVGLMAGGKEPVRSGGPASDGLYEAWEGEEVGGSAVGGLDAYVVAGAGGAEGGQGAEEGRARLRVAIVTEGGRLVVLESGDMGAEPSTGP